MRQRVKRVVVIGFLALGVTAGSLLASHSLGASHRVVSESLPPNPLSVTAMVTASDTDQTRNS